MFTLKNMYDDIKNGMSLPNIHRKYGGSSFYVTARRPDYKDCIINDFNGFNHGLLSNKHNVTIDTVKRILLRHKPNTKKPKEVKNLEGTFTVSDNEVINYKNHSMTFNLSYNFDLAHLKAVYDIGIEELLKSECLIGLEIPKDYTFNDFVAQVKDDNVHTIDSLKEHLAVLLQDMIRLLKHTKELK